MKPLEAQTTPFHTPSSNDPPEGFSAVVHVLEDILASKPTDWPLLRVGLRMCGWGDQQLKYYLVGTPVIWWGGTVSLVVGSLVAGVYIMRQQRKYVDMEPREWEHFLYVGKVALVGWGLHFCESARPARLHLYTERVSSC